MSQNSERFDFLRFQNRFVSHYIIFEQKYRYVVV